MAHRPAAPCLESGSPADAGRAAPRCRGSAPRPARNSACAGLSPHRYCPPRRRGSSRRRGSPKSPSPRRPRPGWGWCRPKTLHRGSWYWPAEILPRPLRPQRGGYRGPGLAQGFKGVLAALEGVGVTGLEVGEVAIGRHQLAPVGATPSALMPFTSPVCGL